MAEAPTTHSIAGLSEAAIILVVGPVLRSLSIGLYKNFRKNVINETKKSRTERAKKLMLELSDRPILQ